MEISKTMFKKNISNLLKHLTLFRLFGIVLIFFGATLPDHGAGSIKTIILGWFGSDFVFLIWCISVVVAGIGLIIYPRLVYFWASAVLPFIFATFHLFVTGVSYTAFLFYSSAYIFLLYYRFKPTIDRIKIIKIAPLRIAGIFNISTGISLLVHPYGAGMDLLYERLDVMLFGAVDPVSAYRFIYLASGLILILFPKLPKGLAQLATAPYIVHALTFAGIVATNTNAWSYFPMFLGVAGIWFYIGGQGYD